MILKDHEDYYHSYGYKSFGTLLQTLPFPLLIAYDIFFFNNTPRERQSGHYIRGHRERQSGHRIRGDHQPQQFQFSAFVLVMNITTTTLTAMNAKVETGESVKL